MASHTDQHEQTHSILMQTVPSNPGHSVILWQWPHHLLVLATQDEGPLVGCMWCICMYSVDPSNSWSWTVTVPSTWLWYPVSPCAGTWTYKLPKPLLQSSCWYWLPDTQTHVHTADPQRLDLHSPFIQKLVLDLLSPLLPLIQTHAYAHRSPNPPPGPPASLSSRWDSPGPCHIHLLWWPHPQGHSWLPGQFSSLPAHPACSLLALAWWCTHPHLLRVLAPQAQGALWPLVLVQLLRLEPPPCALERGPCSGEELEMMFDGKTGHTVLIRAGRGQTSAVTTHLFTHDQPLLSPYPSAFPWLFLPNSSCLLLLPTFHSSFRPLGLRKFQNVLPLQAVTPVKL